MSIYTTTGCVHFVGAGPGDPELITRKGYRHIIQADAIIYAGSLVPEVLFEDAICQASHIYNSAHLTLEETHAIMVDVVSSGGSIVRLHTGDCSLYGAIKEQIELLEQDCIPYDVTPGVTTAFAGIAQLATSFTVPECTQSLIITRLAGRTPVPEQELLRNLASHKTAMAIYLSGDNPKKVQEELELGGLESTTPIAIVYKVGWSDEKIITTTLAQLALTAEKYAFKQHVTFLVLPGENAIGKKSQLYNKNFTHGCRDSI